MPRITIKPALLAAIGLAVLVAVPFQVFAQSDGGPTLITPRVGVNVGEEAGLPQTPEAQQPSPEEMRRLLRLQLMEIEGGDAYVRQACGDLTWQDDYQRALEAIQISDQPVAVQAFKDGWNESKQRLGSEIASCDVLMGDIN
ncbi:MAG: hypothetical protein AAF556_03770 [Pseudomonadota bacterium]